MRVKRDETCRVTPGLSSSEDIEDFVMSGFSRKVWAAAAAARLQWISTGEVPFQPGSERQVRKWSVSWGPLSGTGWKPRAAARERAASAGGQESPLEQRRPGQLLATRRGS